MIGTSKLTVYGLAIPFFTLMPITSAFAMQLAYAQVNINTNHSTTTSNVRDMQNDISLITNILAKNLESHIQKAGAILEITSKLPQVRDIPFAPLLNQTLATLHGIPQDLDIEKRHLAKNIIDSNSDLYEIFFIMPNGDMYFDEPYPRQQISTTTNLGFRDYFKGVIRTNDTYLGDLSASASSGQRQSIISVPVYSLEDNSTLVGVWAGGLDIEVLNKELQSLNLTANNKRVVYTDDNGQKLADSDMTKSTSPESFANLNIFKNATNGQSGSIMDTVDNTNMLITYKPVKAFQNTYVVLLMHANNSNIN